MNQDQILDYCKNKRRKKESGQGVVKDWLLRILWWQFKDRHSTIKGHYLAKDGLVLGTCGCLLGVLWPCWKSGNKQGRCSLGSSSFRIKSEWTSLQQHQTAMPLRPRASSQPGRANTLPSLKNITVLRPRASSSHSKSPLEDELSCPVCCEVFTDPVVLKCSHSFCRVCLQQFWNRKAAKRECPVCRRKSSLTEPTVSLALKNVCDAILQEQKRQASARAGSVLANGTPKPEALCATHGEGLKLFCQNDEEVLCCVCQTSKKHQGHSVCPLEEAANDLKVIIFLRIFLSYFFFFL